MEVPGGGTKSPVPPTREVHGGHGGTNSVIFCSYLRVFCSYLRVYCCSSVSQILLLFKGI